MHSITIVRHGETHSNKKKLFVGQSEGELARLNDAGISQAEEVGRLLSDQTFDRIFCSPQIRTRQTAGIILDGRQAEIEFDPRLMEINFGELEGEAFMPYFQSMNLTRQNWFEPNWKTPFPGGESFQDCYERQLDFVAAAQIQAEDRVLIITHNVPLKLLLAILADRPPLSMLAEFVPTCAVFRVSGDLEGDGKDFKRINPPEENRG